MNEFDEELSRVLDAYRDWNNAMDKLERPPEWSLNAGQSIEAIKQAVAKHIIGEPLDVTPEGLGVEDVNTLTTEETVRLAMAKGMNLEKVEARQKLNLK